MPRILIIDDEPDVRGFCRLVLEEAGYEVEEAEDGDAGLDAHQARPADLLLVDLFMPNRDGFEALRALRKWSTVPVLLISGGVSDRTFLNLAGQLGAVGTVLKPFSPGELLAAVCAAMG